MIKIVGDGNPTIPEDFKAKLRAYDPSLTVTWHHKRHRFTIEQCVEHFAATPEHTHVCRRIYVWLVRDEADHDAYMPLGDHVIEKLRSIDTQRQGYGPGDHAKWCADREIERLANEEIIERKSKESVINARKDNKRQLLRAIHLCQQHSLQVNQ